MNINENIMKKAPLVHCLTNNVVKNFTANGLLAIGASPIMADNPMEVSEVAKKADAILINTGTLMDSDMEAMLTTGTVANNHQKPIVLDPVAVGSSSFRKQACLKFLNAINFTVIKGNAGEMAALVDEKVAMKGVDSVDPPVETTKLIANKVATTFQTIAVITGEKDVISNGKETYINEHGNEMLTRITGAGCLLGAIIGANLACEVDHFKATSQIIEFYTKAAERAIASSNVHGPGTFQVHFLDALHHID